MAIKFNAQLLANILKGVQLAPLVVAGVQAIHGDAISGADKKTLAMESLQLATATADAVLPPGEKAMADAASALVSDSIDKWVTFFKSVGHPSFTPSTTVPTK